MIRRTSSATEMVFSFAIFSNAFRKIGVRAYPLLHKHTPLSEIAALFLTG